MKRFLILSILTAFLAIPAISMADGGGAGAAAVPSITIKANSVNSIPTATGSTSAMQTETYTMTKGGFSFTVNDVNSSDQTQGQTFKGQLAFNGPAACTTDPTKTLSNLFINMSGLVLNAQKTPTAVIGEGAISGSVVHTDPKDGPQTASFTGAYSMKVALSGFVTTTDSSGSTNTNPTKGTAVITMTIAGVTVPGVDGGGNPIVVPAPLVLTVTLPTVAFNVLGGGGPGAPVTGAATSGWALSHDGTTSLLTLSQIGPLVAGTIVETQNDGTTKIQPISGTVSGGNVNMYVTDTHSNTDPDTGITTTTTSTTNVTGVLTGTWGMPGTYMSGTYVSSDSAGDWSATEGALSSWGLSHTTTAGKDKGQTGTGTLSLVTQTGGNFIGTITDKGGLNQVTGTIISNALNMTITHANSNHDPNTGITTITVNTTTVTGTVKSGTFGKSGCAMSGTWTNDDDSGDQGNWNSTEK